ncbi:acetate kinase [Candidatus Magnetomonas plexicatena]|nr:acetate kinase [Nitrospirales bacterium LBB_01]
MKVLVINCGSSSLKYSLFNVPDSRPLFEGLIEKIGSTSPLHKIKTPTGGKELPCDVKNIGEAFQTMEHVLINEDHGVLKSLDEIQAVGHRVVHGGDRFSASVVINKEVKDAIRDCCVLAPLHNPYNLAGIDEMEKLLSDVPAVAVFDTAFHQSMAEHVYRYALPYTLCNEKHIRRYGFHGTNHNYVALAAAMYLKKPIEELKLITCHLGNGTSMCAIDGGLSVDTSMGLTPLEGLVMGTRGGDIDPGVLLYLMREGSTAAEIDTLLNKESGLKGITGSSNDMREVLSLSENGDDRAKLAVAIFVYRIKKYVGAYVSILGGLDAFIFTGGIGENSDIIRSRVCTGLEHIDIRLSDARNKAAKAVRGNVVDISADGSNPVILIVPADEERMITRETIHALERYK